MSVGSPVSVNDARKWLDDCLELVAEQRTRLENDGMSESLAARYALAGQLFAARGHIESLLYEIERSRNDLMVEEDAVRAISKLIADPRKRTRLTYADIMMLITEGDGL